MVAIGLGSVILKAAKNPRPSIPPIGDRRRVGEFEGPPIGNPLNHALKRRNRSVPMNNKIKNVLG